MRLGVGAAHVVLVGAFLGAGAARLALVGLKLAAGGGNFGGVEVCEEAGGLVGHHGLSLQSMPASSAAHASVTRRLIFMGLPVVRLVPRTQSPTVALDTPRLAAARISESFIRASQSLNFWGVTL